MDKERTKINDYTEIPDESMVKQDMNEKKEVKMDQMDRKDFIVLNGMLWECFGTLALVFGALNCGNEPLPTGIVIGVAVALTVQQSGSHFNPAVSLNFYLEKHLSLKGFLAYIILQLIGAFLGILLFVALNQDISGPNVENPNLNHASYFFSEFTGAFFLILMINIQIHQETQLTKDLLIIVADFILAVITSRQLAYSTGGSINPGIATSYKKNQFNIKRLFFMSWITNGVTTGAQYLWFFILGPLFGCAFSNLFYHKIFVAYFNKLNVEVIKKKSIDEENKKLIKEIKVEEYDEK